MTESLTNMIQQQREHLLELQNRLLTVCSFLMESLFICLFIDNKIN